MKVAMLVATTKMLKYDLKYDEYNFLISKSNTHIQLVVTV